MLVSHHDHHHHHHHHHQWCIYTFVSLTSCLHVHAFVPALSWLVYLPFFRFDGFCFALTIPRLCGTTPAAPAHPSRLFRNGFAIIFLYLYKLIFILLPFIYIGAAVCGHGEADGTVRRAREDTMLKKTDTQIINI